MYVHNSKTYLLLATYTCYVLCMYRLHQHWSDLKLVYVHLKHFEQDKRLEKCGHPKKMGPNEQINSNLLTFHVKTIIFVRKEKKIETVRIKKKTQN